MTPEKEEQGAACRKEETNLKNGRLGLRAVVRKGANRGGKKLTEDGEGEPVGKVACLNM